MVTVEWTKRRREAVQRGGRASEKNQNHKPDVTAPVCTDRKFLLLRGVSARITHHARDTPATFTVFSQLNARLPTVRAPLSSAFFFCFVFVCFFVFIFTPTVFSETTVKESSLLFSQSFVPTTQTAEEECSLFFNSIFASSGLWCRVKPRPRRWRIWSLWSPEKISL